MISMAKPKKKRIRRDKAKYFRTLSDEVCPTCGLAYEKFKTGLTGRQVSEMLWNPNEDPETWKYRRRHTILGLWRQIKQEMWDEHKFWCYAESHDGGGAGGV